LQQGVSKADFFAEMAGILGCKKRGFASLSDLLEEWAEMGKHTD
jgi:hypothetical protein